MRLFSQLKFLLQVNRSHNIARRYFVVNGFDGALTMLGLIIGFLLSKPAELSVVINACLGVAIALGVSGFSSAYISEVAERKRALGKLEQAMVRDLQDSAHGEAARLAPLIIAFVNGFSPLCISVLILLPLWLSKMGVSLVFAPLYVSISVALTLIFALGVFLGRVAGSSWLGSGVRTLLVAMLTAGLIYLFADY